MYGKEHSGQVALVMVLIMTVISAIAVSVASRSTVETRIQQMNVENTEAMLTAQSGLEASIAQNAALIGSLGSGKEYQVSLSDVGTDSITSEKISTGQSFEVNLEGATNLSGVKIYWKAATSAGVPAIFATEIGDNQNVDYAYDSTGSNGFTRVVSGGALDGVNYTYAIPSPISLTPASKKLRITVLGAEAFLGIEPVGGQFPPQFADYRSVAGIASSEQTVVKYGIEYKESKTDQLPSVFDYALFSGGTIVQ